jgi:PhnB protein
MKGFNPYFFYPGNCRDALNFYKECCGGEIIGLQTYDDAQMASSPEQKGKVMHSTFKSGSVYFMASDVMPGQPYNSGNNITLNIDFENTGDQAEVFEKLSQGGKVNMPLQDTFWGARYGMLTDKFGVNWMVNCELKK